MLPISQRYRRVKHLAVPCHEMYLLSEYQIYNYYYYNRQRIKTLSNSENDVIGCPKCLAPNMSAPLLTQPQFELQTAPSHFSLNILLHFTHSSGIDFSTFRSSCFSASQVLLAGEGAGKLSSGDQSRTLAIPFRSACTHVP